MYGYSRISLGRPSAGHFLIVICSEGRGNAVHNTPMVLYGSGVRNGNQQSRGQWRKQITEMMTPYYLRAWLDMGFKKRFE